MAHKKEKVARRMVTIPEAAEYLGMTSRNIRNLLEDGTLTGYRVGSGWIRLRIDELEAAIKPVTF